MSYIIRYYKQGPGWTRETSEILASEQEARDFYHRWKDRVFKVEMLVHKDVTQEFQRKENAPSEISG